MPRGTDYIDLCNLNRHGFEKWLCHHKWKTERIAVLEKRRALNAAEIKGAIDSWLIFKSIASKWVSGEEVTDFDRRTIRKKYFMPRRDGFDNRFHPVNFWYYWPTNKPNFDSIEFSEIIGGGDILHLLEFHLYHEFLSDVRAAQLGQLKPKRCAAYNCELIFRPGRKHRKYCSSECGHRHRVRNYQRKKEKINKSYLLG